MGRFALALFFASALAAACAAEPLTESVDYKRALKSLLQWPFNGPTGPVSRLFRLPATGAQSMNTPAVDAAGNIYVTETVGNVYCLNGATGGLVWQYHHTDGSTLGSPVVATYGALFIGTTKGVLAIYYATGEWAWAYGDGTATFLPSTVIVDPDIDSSNSVFVAGRGNSRTGILTSINGGNGIVYWNTNTTGPSADALVGGGQVLVGYPGQYVNGGSVVVTAFDSTSGAQVWSKLLTSAPGVYTQFLFTMDSQNRVYIGWLSGGGVATVQCLISASGGAIYWTVNTNLLDNAYGVLGPQNLILASVGGVQAYNAVTGNAEWQSTTGLTNLEVPIVAAQGEYVYIASGGLSTIHLSALDQSTGAVIWSFADPDARGVWGMPTFDAAGTLYIESWSTSGSSAYALNPTNGQKLWGYRVDSGAQIYYDTAVVVGNGVLVLGDDTQIIGIAHAPSSNGGAIAAGVLVPIFLIGGIAGAVWWFKYKRPGTFPISFSSFGIGGSKGSSGGYGASAVPAGASSTGSYQSSTVPTAYTSL